MDRPSWQSSAPSQVPPTVLPFQPGHLLRPLLGAWTGVLVVLVVSASRAIPPVVLVLLLPYLVLVAWHLLAHPGRVEAGQDPIPEDSPFRPRPDLEPEATITAPSASVDDEEQPSVIPEAKPAPSTEKQPSTTATVRAKRRIKPKAVPEPSPASWVQVAPGRFVRGEEPQPSSDAPVAANSIGQAPESSTELTDEDSNHGRLPLDASTEGFVVGDPAGQTEVPVTTSGAS